MPIRLFSIASNLHSEIAFNSSEEDFIVSIEHALGEGFIFCDDFASYDPKDSIIYVRTGGTESIFLEKIYSEGLAEGTCIRLLTSGCSNSLAASMEILSFLNLKGLKGRILHGDAAAIAKSISGENATGECVIVRTLDKHGILAGKRYGVVGKPSDWLISSTVDYAKARESLGCELIDIDIRELVELASSEVFPIPECLRTVYGKAPFKPKFGCAISAAQMQKASDIYGALRKLIAKYELDGLTLRCFDLLTALENTGCLGLAILNAEGFVATCEGDIPAMLSMAVCREMTGVSGFQVNLSRISGGKMLFAHCTVPLNMVGEYCLDTHFESGIGIGIHGEFDTPVAASLFKLGADMEHYVLEDVVIDDSRYEDKLCRTQIIVKGKTLEDYLLHFPLGNHHVICPRFNL